MKKITSIVKISLLSVSLLTAHSVLAESSASSNNYTPDGVTIVEEGKTRDGISYQALSDGYYKDTLSHNESVIGGTVQFKNSSGYWLSADISLNVDRETFKEMHAVYKVTNSKTGEELFHDDGTAYGNKQFNIYHPGVSIPDGDYEFEFTGSLTYSDFKENINDYVNLQHQIEIKVPLYIRDGQPVDEATAKENPVDSKSSGTSSSSSSDTSKESKDSQESSSTSESSSTANSSKSESSDKDSQSESKDFALADLAGTWKNAESTITIDKNGTVTEQNGKKVPIALQEGLSSHPDYALLGVPDAVVYFIPAGHTITKLPDYNGDIIDKSDHTKDRLFFMQAYSVFSDPNQAFYRVNDKQDKTKEDSSKTSDNTPSSTSDHQSQDTDKKTTPSSKTEQSSQQSDKTPVKQLAKKFDQTLPSTGEKASFLGIVGGIFLLLAALVFFKKEKKNK